ncbi:thiamine pyrophosphate-dependent enzyme [Occallatibacter riparius]|uniref:Thiamine pyrophosphate-dependent enzyme n=1 Tax=Occallatibacter riparius TaxID=1002689 RepID=A0A9J7BKJ4_9BACT|nr:thiamine pyrophosphate-dependent enzyme [Occallatibacter riparius]UWZ83352.1 thiamine pyrophosphate-dependent enzyme [Occallatibacter riparius]
MSEKKNGAGEEKQEFSLISNETLLELYRRLVKASARSGRSKGWVFDAAAVAVAQDLFADDVVIAQDADVLQVMPPNGRAGSESKAQFGAELERAAGFALTQKTRKSGKVAVVFGGAEHGQAWLDALEVARVHRLPMIFVAELREEVVHKRRGARKESGAELEPGTELARIVVDGHDVVGSYRVAHEAVDRARKGRGATLIECTEFRVPGQRRQNAVAAMESYLRGKGLLKQS